MKKLPIYFAVACMALAFAAMAAKAFPPPQNGPVTTWYAATELPPPVEIPEGDPIGPSGPAADYRARVTVYANGDALIDEYWLFDEDEVVLHSSVMVADFIGPQEIDPTLYPLSNGYPSVPPPDPYFWTTYERFFYDYFLELLDLDISPWLN